MTPLQSPSNQYGSLDEIEIAILGYLLDNGEYTCPRGIPTREVRGVSFTLGDPRRRCILNPRRRWSLPLAIGELCWHLSGSRKAAVLAYYAPTWTGYADAQGEIRGSCYGSKIFNSPPSPTVWELTRQLLTIDPATRRAVLYFNDATAHLDPSCPDAACATSLQFILRNGALDAILTMRSNDAILGLPYDIFLFTSLQELMAVDLGVSLGAYHHFVGSLHLYEKHRARADQIVRSNHGGDDEFCMPPLVDASGMQWLPKVEQRIRTGQEIDLHCETVGAYWRDLAEVLLVYRGSRETGWPSALHGFSSIYRRVVEPLAA